MRLGVKWVSGAFDYRMTPLVKNEWNDLNVRAALALSLSLEHSGASTRPMLRRPRDSTVASRASTSKIERASTSTHDHQTTLERRNEAAALSRGDAVALHYSDDSIDKV